MNKTNKQTSGVVFILLSALCFATGGLLIKMNTWSPMTINGMRSIFALIVMVIYMAIEHHRFVINKAVVFGAFANFGMSITFVTANKMTTAANAIVLQFAMPVFIVIILWIFWKEKPDAMTLLCIGASMLGVVIFFFDDLNMSGMIGNIIAIVSGIFYAIVFVIKRIPGSDFESSVILSYIIGITFCIPTMLKEESLLGTNLAIAVVMGCVQVAAAFIFLSKGLDLVPPVTASLISMIEPVLNPMLVALFYGEMIGKLSLVGAVIVLGSATFYNVYSIKKNK